MMNKNIFLTLSLCSFIFCGNLLSQEPYFEWVRTAGGIGADDIAHDVETDPFGNVYTVGLFSTPTDFDPGPGTVLINPVGWGIFIQKLDAAGNFVWVKSFDSNYADGAFDLATDNSGNIFVTGRFHQTIDFDPGAGVFNLVASTPANSPDVFVLKLDYAGNFVWAKSMGGPTNQYALGIITDFLGNVIITGSFDGTSDFDPGAGTFNLTCAGMFDVFVVKLDNSGNFVWARSMGGTSDDYGNAVAVDQNGNIYATGHYQGTADFDPGPGFSNLVSNGLDEIFIQKLDPAGNLVWVHSYGSSGSDRGHDIHVDPNGDILTTGYFSGTIDFDAGLGISNQSATGSTVDIFIQKLSTDGDLIWVNVLSGTENEYGNCVRTDPDGNVYVSGGFQGTVDFDAGAGIANLSVFGDDDVFVYKADINGSYSWAVSFGHDADDRSFALTLDNSGNVFVVGQYWTQPFVDFDFGPGEYLVAFFSGSRDFFVEKISQCTSPGNPVPDLTSLPDINSDCPIDNLIAPTATHYCAGSVTGKPDVILPITTIGTTVVTWTFDVGYGYMSTQTQNVILTADVTPPLADVTNLPDIFEQCSATPSVPTATDNCSGSLSAIPDVSFPITTPGLTTVNWTYTDNAGNNSVQTQNVNITGDITAPVPVLSSLPNLSGSCSLLAATPPTASDNCSGTITAYTTTTFPIVDQGTTVITWIYDDGNGNSSSQTQNVILSDILSPVPIDISLPDLTDECSVNPTIPQAIDNCDGIINGVANVSFPITTQGTTFVEWTFSDGNGNNNYLYHYVIIEDITAPVPDDLFLEDTASNCPVASLVAPQGIDNCSGAITAFPDVSFPISAQGTTIITWTYEDGQGNSTTLQQNVTITPIDNSVSQNSNVITANASGYTYQWFDCDNGMSAITGETNQTFTATSNGNYGVEISNGICSVISNCINVSDVGITDSYAQSISIYPNPVHTNLQIFQKQQLPTRIIIKDSGGKTVYETQTDDQQVTIDMSHLADGIYYFSLISSQGSFQQIVVKQ